MKTCDTCQLAKPMIFEHYIPTGTSIVVNYYCSLPNMYHGREFNFLPIFEYQECKHYEPRISNNDRSVKYASKCFECHLEGTSCHLWNISDRFTCTLDSCSDVTVGYWDTKLDEITKILEGEM